MKSYTNNWFMPINAFYKPVISISFFFFLVPAFPLRRRHKESWLYVVVCNVSKMSCAHDECNYHDSLYASVIEGMAHCIVTEKPHQGSINKFIIELHCIVSYV